MSEAAKIYVLNSSVIQKAVFSTSLSSSQKMVLLAIVSKLDWTKDSTESVIRLTKGQISSLVGSSLRERQIQRTINFLREMGFIEIQTRKSTAKDS